MQLKRIDIAGFKSFAEKTVIEFNEGVTAIVGPNGSGKSNIIEAIRWVMGEQSARSLRGGKMPDIIFSGSESRKPVNIAEVTLVLDNEDHFLPLDYTEVSITRRILRSGESEFFINQQACRLKDIVDLFMDSGLGRESFSIISQGKVESIFNSKPEERRVIFEEAAGVLKYKKRKKSAEQKLVETKDNLNRVQDIVYELAAQVEPLREQSSIAKDYLMQKSQLHDVEIALTAVEIDQLTSEIHQKKMAIDACQQRLTYFQEEISQLERDSRTLHNEQQTLKEQIETCHSNRLQLVKKIEQLDGQKNLLSERNKNSQENREKMVQNLQQLTSLLEQLEQEANETQQALADKEKEKTQLSRTLTKAEKEFRMLSGDQKEMEADLRDEYIEWMQQETSLKNEQMYLKKSSSQYEQKKMRTSAAKASMLDREKKLKEQITEQEQALKDSQQTVAEKLLHYQEKQTALQQMRTTREKKENQLYDAMRIVQQAKAKRESLQELSEDYAGFYQGVREVLKNKEQIKGMIGAVAELIVVPKSLTLALDIALGASSQHIIVEDDMSGKKAIEFLKQRHLGRATFLPLTTIKPRRLPEAALIKARAVSGFVGIGSEIISYPPEIERVLHYLLGTTLITENLSSANQLAKLLHYKYRVVSLEGDVMNAGGSMTGGASKKGNKGSLLGRKNDLQTLEEQIKKMDAAMQEKEVDVRGMKQQEKKIESELETLRKVGEELRMEEQESKSKLNRLRDEKNHLERELKAQAFESNAAKEEADENAAALKKIDSAIEEAQKKRQLIKERMEGLSAQNDEKEAKKSQLTETIQQSSTRLAAVKEQVAYLLKEQKRLAQQRAETKKRAEQLETQLTATDVSDNGHLLSQKEVKEQLAEATQKKSELEKHWQSLKTEQENGEEQLESLTQAIIRKNNQKQAVLEQRTAEEVAASRLDSAVESRLELLSGTYAITYEAALKDFPLAVPLEEAKRQVKLLKQGIEELGPVNLNAIEEFERVNERYTFLIEQKEDLSLARNSLLETMDEMDEEVTRRFSQMFTAIQGKFNLVFTQLFGGGSAELKLTDPNNLLTTGIEIIAQPPGKKLQQLSLLSGGERALTAIALLFSILQVRPVPFCVLDEVEAALDEANVVRFGRYLRKFEEETQFIVITHRKGTMEEANALYGVTMQESGVSKVVSVRLEEVNV